jgi:hopanoid biosynthesis associated radical SAM protein HpnH
MRYPLGLVLDSARHLASRKLRGDKRISVTLSLDPMGGSTGVNGVNGSAGAEGRRMLSVEECLAAVDECRTPVIAISGGEPLDYPEIGRLTKEILDRGKHVFIATDGSQIRRRLHMVPPYTNFFWNIRLHGTAAVHDARTGRPGLFVEALDGVKVAKNAGFFVIVTTTIYEDTDLKDVAALYELLHKVHVDGYLLAPHYPAGRLCKNGCASFHAKMQQKFREAQETLSAYNVLTSPLYLEYLRGEREMDCSAWGNPVFGPQGWAAPCSVQSVKFEESYKGLLDNTIWENYGRGMHPRCEPCASPAGYESSALIGLNSKVADIWKMLAWQFQGNLGEKRERVPKP